MLREFTDNAGTPWKVWDVYPSGRASTQGAARGAGAENVVFVGRDLSDGWLCFESSNEKRRLAPIPPEWEICESPLLEAFCKRAGVATRTTPSEASDAVDSAMIEERGARTAGSG